MEEMKEQDINEVALDNADKKKNGVNEIKDDNEAQTAEKAAKAAKKPTDAAKEEVTAKKRKTAETSRKRTTKPADSTQGADSETVVRKTKKTTVKAKTANENKTDDIKEEVKAEEIKEEIQAADKAKKKAAKTITKTETKTQAETKVQAKKEAKTETKVQAEKEAKTEAKAKAEKEAKTEAKAKAETKAAKGEAKNEDIKKEENKEDKPQKERKKKAYGMIFLTHDENEGISQKLIEPKRFERICDIGVGCLAAVVLICIFCAIRFVYIKNYVDDLNTQMEAMRIQNETVISQMEKDKAELEEKVSLLSTKVASTIVQEEELEEKKIPSGLPVSGKVSVLSGDEQAAGEEAGDIQESVTMIVFGVQKGAKVMAAGNGVVTFVGIDEEYGGKVQIDHGNGYISVYRYNGEAKVKEGEEVLRGTLIFEVEATNGKVGYQIIQDELFINPMDVMEISG